LEARFITLPLLQVDNKTLFDPHNHLANTDIPQFYNKITLLRQNMAKRKKSDELIIASKELAFQDEEKEKLEAE
jgi:hypothetical protein